MSTALLQHPENLVSFIEYQKKTIVSKALVQNEKGSITLFAFDAGEGLSEHTAPFDAFVMVIDGALEITVGGVAHKVHAGEALMMPANVPHALAARVPAKMLLVMIKG